MEYMVGDVFLPHIHVNAQF